MKKIFITGGAGYVGSCLVPELLKKGYSITVYDILYYTDSFLPLKNSNLTVIKGDVRNTTKVLESCRDHDVFLPLGVRIPCPGSSGSSGRSMPLWRASRPALPAA